MDNRKAFRVMQTKVVGANVTACNLFSAYVCHINQFSDYCSSAIIPKPATHQNIHSLNTVDNADNKNSEVAWTIWGFIKMTTYNDRQRRASQHKKYSSLTDYKECTLIEH